MNDDNLIKLLKICIVIGLLLILLGVYFHNFSDFMESLGVTGIVISAACIALGMVLSLPTKMYLTFLLVKREQEEDKSQNIK